MWEAAGRRRWKRAGFAFAAVAAAGLGLAVLLVWFENSLLYFPAKYPAGDWQPAGLVVEDAWFTAADGTRLHGWFVPCDAPRAVVLFAHGNAGNVTGRVDMLRILHQLRVAVLAFDYRGYGRSQGTPNEPGIVQDAEAARSWLCTRTGLAPAQLVLLGESLGGAVAVELAARGGARALILENTFSSLARVAGYHFPHVPVGWILRSKFDSRRRIAHYQGPLLQRHGDADTIVPLAEGRRLFDAAPGPKQFLVIAGGEHNDPPSSDYVGVLDEFLDRLPPVSAPMPATE